MSMTAAQSLALMPGKHNMASEAFQELKLARAEGRAPKGQELSFNDVLDTLNPLQHLPVIGQAYRALTGDKISPSAKVTGDALYGGPFGAVASIATEAVSSSERKTAAAPTALAANMPVEPKIAAPLAAQIAATDAAAKPAAFSAPDDALVTGAIAQPAAKVAANAAQPAPSAPVPPAAQSGAPLPKLSSEAFDALIRSFPGSTMTNPATAEAAAAKIAPDLALPEKAKPVTEPRKPLSLTPPALASEMPKPAMPDDLAAVMGQSLDKLTALRSEKGDDEAAAF